MDQMTSRSPLQGGSRRREYRRKRALRRRRVRALLAVLLPIAGVAAAWFLLADNGGTVGDGAGGPDVRRRGARTHGHLGEVRDGPAQKIEKGESPAGHRVLDVVAEDPEEQHVAGDVQEAAVHEHRAEEREPGVGLAARLTAHSRLALAGHRAAGHEVAVLAGVRDLVGDQPPAHQVVVVRRAEADVAAVLKEHEHEHVDRNERDREHGEPPRRDVVLQRDQGPLRVSQVPGD